MQHTLAGARRGLPAVYRFDFKWMVIGASIAIVAYFALVPLGFLLWQSFLTPKTFAKAAEFTLENYKTAYSSRDTIDLFINSLKFAVGTALVAFAIGITLAWINERTNTPFKMFFYALSLIPLIIPGILFTISWILLASPEIGIINLILQGIFQTKQVFVNIYSIAGMVWVDGLHYSPIAFLMMTATFRSMDPALEESAMMSGAGIPQVVSRITLKLAWPAICATLMILFVRAIESFEVPALLGMPVGIQVFVSAIFKAVRRYPSQMGLAAAYAVLLLVLTSLGVYLQSRLSSQGSKYSTVTGKGYRPRPLDIGRWRYLTATLFIAYFLLIVVLPFLVLLWCSLQKFYRVPSLDALGNLTLKAYRYIWDYPVAARSVWNSLRISIGSATLVMLLTAVISWIVVKTRITGRWLLDNLASLPMVFPGLVLGLSLMIFYLHVKIGVYGTIWIMLFAYITRFMPYGIRFNTSSMLQIHSELEESASVSGATWLTTFVKIIMPLLVPGFVGGWIYIVIVSIRELSSSVLLYSPGTEVISIVIWELWQNGQYVELSALGVMFIIGLFFLVMAAQIVGRRFGVKQA